jgi:hypothetical protein
MGGDDLVGICSLRYLRIFIKVSRLFSSQVPQVLCNQDSLSERVFYILKIIASLEDVFYLGTNGRLLGSYPSKSIGHQ